MGSPAVRGEDLYFSEKGVGEVGRKIIGRLANVVAFYELYVGQNNETKIDLTKSSNVLDQWILLRLSETIKELTTCLNNYEIDRAVWPIDDFIDDLSTWYIRRSRDRFKDEGEDKKQALLTTRFVLLETAKLIAPFAPFMAEQIYQKLRKENDLLSVHLEAWPTFELADKDDVLVKMKEARNIVSLGLEFRQSMKVKVRQPLAEVKIKSQTLAGQEIYHQLITDELNVKKISFDTNLGEDIWLDGEITEELINEGIARELIRQIQEKRKQLGLNPSDKISLAIETEESSQKILSEFAEQIKLGTTSQEIKYEKVLEGEEVVANELVFRIKISKV